MPDVLPISEASKAGRLLHPLRLRILGLAREPASASQIARALGLTRQKVNYHVRELARAGFLKKAGRRRKGNLVEQRYQSTARGYVLAPELLGPVRVQGEGDPESDLLALLAQGQSDVLRLIAAGKPRLLSLSSDLRFESPEQRDEFAAALTSALVSVLARSSSPATLEDGSLGGGRPYRLMLACYPLLE
jgi:DNA-binding transcriptional ArsR family regulator